MQRGGRPQNGTGLALENVLGGLPVIGDVQITEVVITEFSTFAGGLQASGTITGASVSVPGLTLTDDFTADVLVSSSGGGQCGIVTLDLGPIDSDVLGLVEVDLPVASVEARGAGAAGVLLCALGSVIDGVADAAVGGLVSALNALLQSPGSLPRL